MRYVSGLWKKVGKLKYINKLRNLWNKNVILGEASFEKILSYGFVIWITWLITWLVSAITIDSWWFRAVGGGVILFGGIGLSLLWLYNNKHICLGNYTNSISSWKPSSPKIVKRDLLPNPAGCTIRKMNLKRRWLKSISFKVKAPGSKDSNANSHWRAGVVLSKDERLNESHLTNKNNILFHVGRNSAPPYSSKWGNLGLQSGVHIITMYHGQGSKVSSPTERDVQPTIPETEIEVKDNDEIEMTFEVTDPRFQYDISVTGYSGTTRFGDEKSKDYRDISEFLNNVFLVAWGDGGAYEVEFSDIFYKTFYRSNVWLKKCGRM